VELGNWKERMERNDFEIACSGCGKVRLFVRQYGYGFMTMDGGDYIDQHYCWICELKGFLMKPVRKVKYLFKLGKSVCDVIGMFGLRRVCKTGLRNAFKIARSLAR
jgi:hypothetical protein